MRETFGAIPPSAGEKGRKQMAFKMIDREIRFPETKGEALGERGADHERAGQPRPARGGESVDFA